MDSILPASRTLSFVFVSPQEEPFLSLFKRLLSSAHTPTTSTIITLIPTVLSLYAFTIHHHYPRILHFYPLPAITPRDEVDRLITSFSYPPHSFLFYSFNLYYFANPSSRRLRWRVAWRLPFFLVLFCRPYKPRLLPLFTCTLSNISLQSRHVAAILVSYLQLFCVFTIINPQKPEGLPPFLSTQISFTPNYTGS